MHKTRILTLQQISESENKYINENSEEKILSIAGKQIAKFLVKKFQKKSILFICGKGNNGNDGIKAANLIETNKYEVFLIKKNINKKDINFLKSKLNSYEIIVDCIFGTGLNRHLTKSFINVIKLINHSKKKVVSIDIPSGINVDTGQVYNLAVNATITLCMGFFKPAHFLIPSKEFCGEKILLKLPLKLPRKIQPKISLINQKKIFEYIPKFNPKININKYDKGHVLIIGGKMAGASRIVALASRKVGAGLSTILVLPQHLKYYGGTEPGTIVSEFSENELLKKDVLVIGPGLGKDFDINLIERIILIFKGKIVVDADAISNFENCSEKFLKLLSSKKSVVITPHAGEFKRIFKFTDNKLYDCFHASNSICNTVLYKGNDSIISSPKGRIWINDNASNSLAIAGSGDLLCGLISGLAAQKMNFKLSILAAISIQNILSNNKNNVIVEDFLDNIHEVMNTIKNNN